MKFRSPKRALSFLPHIIVACALCGGANIVHAQFTASIKTNTINGVVSNWVGNGSYVVGSNTFKDVLQIIGGGVLSNGVGYVGYAVSGTNNAAMVIDTGSVWTNTGFLSVGYSGARNSLTISNGGAVFDSVGQLSGNSTSSSNNVATVTGAGSTWNNQSDLEVGVYGAGNTLTIANGGAVNIGNGGGISFVGYQSSSSNNVVVVTGTGSVWNSASGGDLLFGYESAGNTLIVSNGGSAFSEVVTIGGGVSGNNNTVTITGAGSVLSNSFALNSAVIVGNQGAGNRVTIADGGAVVSVSGSIGGFTGSSNNEVIVTGAGSIWNNSGILAVGSAGASNVLTIAGGSVLASSAFIGYSHISTGIPTNNVIRVNSGSLFVTNALGTGALVVSVGGAQLGPPAGKGELIVNGGSVTVDNLIATNGLNSVVTFNGGTITAGSALIDNGQDFIIGSTSSNATYIPGGGAHFFNNSLVVRHGVLALNNGLVTVNKLVLTNGVSSVVAFDGGELDSAGTFVTNNQEFVVGNGVAGAEFRLLGGVHSFNNGLRIRNASTLTGCGTVNGDVTVDPGGTVFADCGTMTFTGTVTNNWALAADGAALEFNGTVVNNGGILLYNGGTVTFNGTFINNGIISNAGPVIVTSITRLGDDIVVEAPSTNGFRYQLQFTASVDSPVWTNSGTAQAGTGSILTFTDIGGATNDPSRFYQVDVISP